MTTTELFSPWDMDVAHANFNAMCGHGALAAALGTDICRVMQLFPEGGGWVNVPMMEAAIRAAGKTPARLAGWDTGTLPAVTILQFLGRWMEPGVPAAARCRHRHWVATHSGYIWDVNTGKWQSRAEWEAAVPPLLMPKGGTGYEPFRTLILFD